MKINSIQKRNCRCGLTLLELMVVIAILGIIASLTIPRLRIISADRKAREAARIVGVVFSQAAQRALTDGASGILIETNPNIRDQDGVRYAGTSLYLLKALAPYAGDDSGSTAIRVPADPNLLFIDLPFGHATKPVVSIGDKISVNNSSIQFPIVGVSNGQHPIDNTRNGLLIGVGLGTTLPSLPGSNNLANLSEYPFVVHRRPRIQESSRVQLPEGYLIDLRFSGTYRDKKPNPNPPFIPPWIDRDPLPVTGGFIWRSIFHELDTEPMYGAGNREAMVYFSREGVELLTAKGMAEVPTENLDFFVAKYEGGLKNENLRTGSEPDPLDDLSNLWVRVNARSGSVAISPNLPSTGTNDLATRLDMAGRLRDQNATVSD